MKKEQKNDGLTPGVIKKFIDSAVWPEYKDICISLMSKSWKRYKK